MGDFGCGEAALAKEFSDRCASQSSLVFLRESACLSLHTGKGSAVRLGSAFVCGLFSEFYSFDLVKANSFITPCSLSQVRTECMHASDVGLGSRARETEGRLNAMRATIFTGASRV